MLLAERLTERLMDSRILLLDEEVNDACASRLISQCLCASGGWHTVATVRGTKRQHPSNTIVGHCHRLLARRVHSSGQDSAGAGRVHDLGMPETPRDDEFDLH